jgi:hypothetical protein
MKKKSFTGLMVMFCLCGIFSCNKGWTDTRQKELRESCISITATTYDSTMAKTICDCYVQNLVTKFPKGEFTREETSKVMKDCISNK